MLLQKLFRTSIVMGFAVVAVACSSSNDPATSGSASKGNDAQSACEHINDVCGNTEGYKNADCSGSNASYDKLSTTDKAHADAVVVPCIMAAQSCAPAIQCVNGEVAAATPEATDTSTATEVDTEAACEHINNLCESTDGFTTGDCSNSKADYDGLSPADKKVANSIGGCIMDADECQTAYECLKGGN